MADASDFLRMRAGSTNAFRVAMNASGKIIVLNAGGTTIATGTTTLLDNTWYYVEVKGFINGASGTCEVHLNGVAGEIASTTGNFGSTAIDNRVFNEDNNINADFDDFYLCDSTGSAPNNTFLGDIGIETAFPSADGAHTDWAPNTGTAHWSLVNESTGGTFPDGDTTYVSDSTVGHRDSYAFGDLPSLAGTVFGVKTLVYARKDDAGTRQIAAVSRPGTADRDGSTVTLTTSYVYYGEMRETNPDTGGTWTVSSVNGSEFGIKEVA